MRKKKQNSEQNKTDKKRENASEGVGKRDIGQLKENDTAFWQKNEKQKKTEYIVTRSICFSFPSTTHRPNQIN